MNSSFLKHVSDPGIRFLGIIFFVGIILSSLFAASLFARRFSNDREGVGTIIKTRPGEVLIINRRQRQSTVLIKPETKIDFLNDTSLRLIPGQIIFVSGVRLDTELIDAKYIRVLSESENHPANP